MVTNLLLPLPSDGVVCARHQIEATAAAMVTGKVSVAEEEEEGRRSTEGGGGGGSSGEDDDKVSDLLPED